MLCLRRGCSSLTPRAAVRASAVRAPPAAPQLRILDVSENRLSALPRELASLRELKTLKCGRNRVAEAEAGALQLPALQLLELPRNCLARVPPLPASLTTLDLSHNSLVTLPASSVAHLPALRTLVLAGNQLTALPSLVDLPKLDTLDVDDNALEALGDDWSGTPGLRVLFARRNRLTAAGLRPSLFQDTLLDRMELEGNPMTRAQLMAAPASDLFLDRRRKRVDRALKADLDPDRTLAGLER